MESNNFENRNLQPQEGQKLAQNEAGSIYQRDENTGNKVHPEIIADPLAVSAEGSQHRDMKGAAETPLIRAPLSPPNDKSSENLPLIHKVNKEKAKEDVKPFVKQIVREEKPKNLAEYQKTLLPEGVTSVESMLNFYEIERTKKKSGIMKNFEQVHKKNIKGVRITPDGRYIMTASEDKSIKVIEFETGTIVHHFENAHTKRIVDMSLTKDGKYILTASEDGTLKIFDWMEKREVHQFNVEEDYIYAVQTSHDGRFAFGGKSSLKMYDLQTKKLIQEFKDKQIGAYFSLALTPDDRYVILGREKSVAVFDLRLKQMHHLFENAHSGRVRAVATTPDGRLVISGSANGSIKIFELEAKEEVFHWKDIHADGICSIAVSSNGKYLVSGSDDKSVAIFDLEKRELISRFQNLDKKSVKSVTISADCKYIVVGSESGDVKVLWLEMKQKIETFPKIHREPAKCLVVTPDNKFAITSSFDSCVKVFNIQEQKYVHTFKDVFGEIVELAVTSNSEQLLVCSGNSIKIFDLKEMKQVDELKEDKYRINKATITPDDKFFILTAHEDIEIVDLKTKKKVASFKDPEHNELKYIVANPNSSSFIASDRYGNIKIFDIKTKQVTHQFKNPEGQHAPLDITSDGKYLAIGSEKGTITLYDLQAKQVVHQFRLNALKDEPTTSLKTFQNRFLVAAYMKGSIKIFDLESKMIVHHVPQAHLGVAISAIVTSDGKFMVSIGEDQSLRIYSLQAKNEIAVIKLHSRCIIYWVDNGRTNLIDAYEAMAVTPDEKYVITAWLGCGDIRIHDVKTQREIHVFEKAHSWRIVSIAASADSKRLVSVDSAGEAKVWDLVNFKEVFGKEEFHSAFIQKVLVTPDSRHFITSSYDKSVKITDLATLQPVHEFKDAVQDKEHTLAISPDGKLLFASQKGTINVFDLITKEHVYQFVDVHTGDIVAMMITPNNKYMISGSRDKSVKMFDLHTKQLVYNLTTEYEYYASSIAVTENSRYFIIGCKNSDIKIFDIERRKLVQACVSAADRNVKDFAVVNNGKVLIMVDTDGNIRFLEFELEKFGGQNTDLEYLQQEIFFQYNGMRSYSAFNSVDDFLFEAKINLAILVSSAINCQDFCVQPFAWNILHIAALQGNHAFIKELPEISSKFKVPFLLDCFGKTPLHYLIAHRRVDYASINCMLSYICDYLDDCYKRDIYEFQDIMKSLTMLLPFILNKMEARHKERFLTICFATSPVGFNQELPAFGHANSTSCFHELPVFDEKAKGQIWKDGETAVSCETNFLCLDYNANSQDMKTMVDLMIKQKSEDFFKTPLISKLIDHLWSQSLTPLLMSFLAFSVYMGGLSVYICLSEGNLAYEIVLLALSGLFILYEGLQIFDLGCKDYAKNFWNWLDMGHLLLTVAFLITRIAKSEDELARAWIETIVVLLGYLRWVSFLRIFQQTRNLIQVILTIAKDMVGFVVIIAIIIFGFSIIFLIFERESEYGIYLYNTYSILYGPLDIEDDAKYSVSLRLIMVVIAFLLNVLLLNLLISIMGDSYDKILEKRDKTDALTRLEMMSEAMTYMKVFKGNYKSKRGYLLYCLSMNVEEDEGGQDEWEGRINVMKKLLKQSNEENKDMREVTEKRIQELNQKMESCYQRLEQRLEQKIKESNDKLEQNISIMIQGILQGKGNETSSTNKMVALQDFLQK